MRYLVLLLLSLCVGCFISINDAQTINNRPIIGIYTQPSDTEVTQFGEEFIAASYIKFVEGAGARAAPIRQIPPSC
jgi:gamma-glutamyl hydrolase